RRRHTRFSRDWSSDVCSSDLTGHHARATDLLDQLLTKLLLLLLEGVLELGEARLAEVEIGGPAGLVERATRRGDGLLHVPGRREIGRASCRERVQSPEGAGPR